MDLITAENVVTLILGVLSCGFYEAIISSSNKLKNCLDKEKDIGDFLEINEEVFEEIIWEKLTLEEFNEIGGIEQVRDFFDLGVTEEIMKKLYIFEFVGNNNREGKECIRNEFCQLFIQNFEIQNNTKAVSIVLLKLFDVFDDCCQKFLDEAIWKEESLLAHEILSKRRFREVSEQLEKLDLVLAELKLLKQMGSLDHRRNEAKNQELMSCYNSSMLPKYPEKLKKFVIENRENVIILRDPEGFDILKLSALDEPLQRLFPEVSTLSDFQLTNCNVSNSKQEAEPKKEYDGYDALDRYWKDLLGSNFAFSDPEDLKQKLFIGDKVVLHDVLLTEWFPVVPGSQYDKDLFKANLQDVKFRAGAIRFNNYNHIKPRLFSAHVVQPFVAHNEICKGIPVTIEPSIFKDKKDQNDFMDSINDFGAIHFEKLTGIVCEIPKKYNKRLKDMYKTLDIPPIGGTNRKPIALNIADKSWLSKPGTPAPLLGTAWTVWDNKNGEYDWHYFWTGIEDHESSLNNAVEKIQSRCPSLLTPSKALFDFDQVKIHFEDAVCWPGHIPEEYKESLKRKKKLLTR